MRLKDMLASKSPDVRLQAEDIIFVPNSAAKSADRRTLEAIIQTATGLAIYGVAVIRAAGFSLSSGCSPVVWQARAVRQPVTNPRMPVPDTRYQSAGTEARREQEL